LIGAACGPPAPTLLRIALPQFAYGEIRNLQELVKLPLMNSHRLSALQRRYSLFAASEDGQANTSTGHDVLGNCSPSRSQRKAALHILNATLQSDRRLCVGTTRADFPLMQHVKQALIPPEHFRAGRFVGALMSVAAQQTILACSHLRGLIACVHCGMG